MDRTPSYASDVAFTSSVKVVQTRKGSRRSYERMEQRGSWQTRITPDLARFIEAQTSRRQRAVLRALHVATMSHGHF